MTDGSGGGRHRLATILVALATVVTTGCVGPTLRVRDYRIHAAVALENVQSVADAAHLATEQAAAGRATQDLLAVIARQAEDTASHAASTFDTRQPPGPRADEIRADVLPILEDTTAVLTDLRIAAYRGDIDQAVEIARSLPGLIARCEDTAERLRS